MENFINFQVSVSPNKQFFYHFNLVPQYLMDSIRKFIGEIKAELRVQGWRQVAEQRKEIFFEVNLIDEIIVFPDYRETFILENTKELADKIDEVADRLSTRIKQEMVLLILDREQFKRLQPL